MILSQRKFLRMIILRDLRYPNDLVYGETNTLDLRGLYCIQLGIRQHINRRELVNPSHSYSTRHKNRYVIPLMKKTIGQKSYDYLAPKLYNFLPDSLKMVTSIHKFKKLLKKIIFDTERKSLHRLIEGQ